MVQHPTPPKKKITNDTIMYVKVELSPLFVTKLSLQNGSLEEKNIIKH